MRDDWTDSRGCDKAALGAQNLANGREALRRSAQDEGLDVAGSLLAGWSATAGR